MSGSIFVKSTGNMKKAELKWDLHNITALEWQEFKPGEYIYSPDFHADGDADIKWFIHLLPNGDEESEGSITVFLNARIHPAMRFPVKAKFTFTAASEKGSKKIWSNTDTKIFGSNEPHLDGHGFCTNIKLGDVLESNYLSLACQVQYADKNPEVKITDLQSQSVPLNNEERLSSLSKDLEQLFLNQSETDVCFIIRGKEIKAHKLILLARSPVFAAMLKSGMKESVENRVEINDIAPDIFEALLRFVYTARVDLTEIDVRDLLAAAHKYLLSQLELECQNYLSERLTTENCVEMLALADLHDCVYLKRSVLHFFRVYRDVIMQSDDWKNLKISNPDLAFHVLENLL